MALFLDVPQLRRFGWVRVESAIPVGLCEHLVEVLEAEAKVPVNDPSRWHRYGGEPRDLLPIWGHQAQWDIRQHPDLHRIWATLWGSDRLTVSLDSCRFTPPWQPGFELYGIHWDHDPWNAEKRMYQGVLALTDTAADQGGFRCVPSLYHDRAAWPRAPIIDRDGENWLANTEGREIVHVSAQTGDLIVWDSRLPHGNSKNRSSKPRIAFYVMMGPFPPDGALRQAQIDSWRTGRCVPWWRSRPGYDRAEPWPPATLTKLGRRLLGLDEWPLEDER